MGASGKLLIATGFAVGGVTGSVILFDGSFFDDSFTGCSCLLSLLFWLEFLPSALSLFALLGLIS